MRNERKRKNKGAYAIILHMYELHEIEAQFTVQIRYLFKGPRM